jgi:N-acetylglucosaminyl-diphospho-decaprenol L-rhamnosyltransferase
VDLSIIIVNWNTRDLLAGCLASLKEACTGLTIEVLVVDNASTDDSAKMVAEEFPDFQLIDAGGNLGFTRGNNLALERTQGDFVLLLNPDTVCPPQSLARLVRFAAEKKSLGSVGPLLVDERGRPTITYGYFPAVRFHWLEFLDPWRLLPGRRCRNREVHIPTREEPSGRVEYVMGACFLMPRSSLEQVGVLDERFFMYFEETDWCLRARKLGLDVWYCAEVEIAHLEGRAAEKASLFTIRQFQKSYRLFVEKNYGPGRVWGYRLAQAVEYGTKALYRRLIPGDRDQNLALSRTYRERFNLQFRAVIQANPPERTESRERH